MKSIDVNPPARDMRLDRLLQVNVGLMTALGAVLLGTGQMGAHSVLLSLMAVFAATTAVIFTDLLGWFQINRTLANLAAIAAVGFSLTDFFGNDAEYQLLAVANLLVYLQIVLLYQEKNERIFWQLLILSLLQVVVSAALNLGFQFGILIVAYMFVAFSAMGLFFFYRESYRFVAKPPSGSAKAGVLRPVRSPTRRRRRGRWPLHATARPLAFRFSGNLAEIFKGRRLLRQIFSMGLTTLLFTVFFFFALPRISNTVWQGPHGLSRSVVGFSQEVTLDTMSTLFESEEEVMRVKFVDPETNEPLRLKSGPYLRGSVLVHYYCGSGKWRQIQWTQQHRGDTLPGVPPLQKQVVRQEFKLQPQPDPVLFAAFPVYHVRSTPNQVKIDRTTRQLIRDDFERAPRSAYQYAMGTTVIRDGEQLPVHVAGRHYRNLDRTYLTRFEPSLCPNIKRVADEVVAAEGVAADDPYNIALALEKHFHEPGRYTYSLNQLGVQRQSNVDPVEDFVGNHHTGHCEYFASALVLMLRSQGIPARMVVGYRAMDYNSLGDFYQVREKEAHAWTEAFLEEEQVPEPLRQQVGVTDKGAWLRLEPTTIMAEYDEEEAALSLWEQAVEWKNYAQGLWSDYVLGMNAERQQTAVYAPLLSRTSTALKRLLDPRAWRRSLAGVSGWGWAGSVVVAGLLVVVLAVALWGSWRLLRYVRQRFKWRFKWLARGKRAEGPSADARHRERIDFYEKLEALLARYGVRRRHHQTQREFALAAADQLAAVSETQRATSLAGKIVDAFYRVRFGRRPLPEKQSQAVDAALGELDHAFADRENQPQADATGPT